jgi:hypothetical protein
MNQNIKRLAAALLAVAIMIRTYSVLSSNDTFSRTYRCFSPTDANQATNTFNDDRQKNYKSPDTGNATTEANALLDILRNLARHDDVTPMGATNIEAVNNVDE